MVEKNSLVAERLELLSNTAMLKKVLDKNEAACSNSSNNTSPRATAFSRYEKPCTTPFASAPPASPKSLISDPSVQHHQQLQQRQSPSPHVVMEAARDSPPLSSYSRNVDAGLVPQDYHHYNNNSNGNGNLHSNNGTHGNPYRGYSAEASRYPPFPPPLSQYMQGMDRYSGDTGSRRSTPLLPLAPHPERSPRMSYSDPSFRVPYGDRRPLAETREASRSFYSPVSEDGEEGHRSSYDALARENFHMREQLHDKDAVISSLQQRVHQLETQISELRQLPTGKISHIPIDDMLRIMEEYGSEVSNQTLPKRRDNIKKASIVRQFRRWNPEFFRYFIHVNGEWIPKLGREGELQRRVEKRREIKRQTTSSSTRSLSDK